METELRKAYWSVVAGFLMWWMELPAPIITLMTLQGIDLIFGALEAALLGKFRATILFRGIVIKYVMVPLMLWACHLTEAPLHLDFHLEVLVAFALSAYEFISILETYHRVGAPFPPILGKLLESARSYLQDQQLAKPQPPSERNTNQ